MNPIRSAFATLLAIPIGFFLLTFFPFENHLIPSVLVPLAMIAVVYFGGRDEKPEHRIKPFSVLTPVNTLASAILALMIGFLLAGGYSFTMWGDGEVDVTLSDRISFAFILMIMGAITYLGGRKSLPKTPKLPRSPSFSSSTPRIRTRFVVAGVVVVSIILLGML